MKNLIKNTVHFLLGIKTKDAYHGKYDPADVAKCPVVGTGAKDYGEYVTSEDGWTTLKFKDPNIQELQEGDVGYKCKEVCDGTCSHHAILKKKENTDEAN